MSDRRRFQQSLESKSAHNLSRSRPIILSFAIPPSRTILPQRLAEQLLGRNDTSVQICVEVSVVENITMPSSWK
jgi:hypothetical protein